MQSRTKLKIKNAIKGTKIGKKLRDMYQKRGFTKKNAEDTFDIFLGFTSLKEIDKNRIVADMLKEARKYSFGFDEYFMFHFYEKTSEERREYVSCRERISYCERMNSIKNMIIFDDKALSYKVFKKYYKRDLAGIFSENDEDIFKNFISQHERFIVKPFDGAGGYGIQIMKIDFFFLHASLHQRVLRNTLWQLRELRRNIQMLFLTLLDPWMLLLKVLMMDYCRGHVITGL